MTSFAALPVQPKLHVSGYIFIEPIYQGSRTTVYRAVETATQQPVVIKVLSQTHPSFSEFVQFRNQYTIAKNLPISGIIQPLTLVPCDNGYGLVMEDFGGISLAQYTQHHPLDLSQVLAIAIQLAAILHDLHQHRVIHKDIKPANILIHPDSKQIKLIDFSIASLLPKETQAIQSPNSLEGTLAYLAPEQTGRMNRAIDYRTDFYALGVSLYQLLTGQLPFTSKDPLALIHSHMAQMPTAVNQVNLALPSMVAAIVAKLMAKNAEDRYQSALGLKHDLEQCLGQWAGQGKIAEFALGERDLSDRFLIPEKLYGREAEVQMLLDAFERVAQGASELMLVAGFSGIGKTAVVNEVHKPIGRQRGYFIKGKFDQFNRNLPFSAFVQALRDLMSQLLSESDAQLKIWKTRILEAIGDNGQVLIEVIPNLEQIIGSQPPAADLSGSAAQNRFNRLFQSFIEVFTTLEHPLVIFLDDLQWADSTSLQLIKLLMEDNGYLLLIGAYRDNEVSSYHPFILTVEELKRKQIVVNTITLSALTFDNTNQLIADTLNCSVEIAQPLTELVERKTQGNPFFTTQFLKTLHADRQLNFDRDQGFWSCDIAQIKATELTDSVVELMAMQLQKLPAETQQALKLAACIGNQFDLSTLAIVLEKSPDHVAKALWQALQDGLILPTSQIYKFFQSEEPQLHSPVNPVYRFLHDRVQQAAYGLIPDTQKQVTHLTIGRLLLNSLSEVELEDQIFGIVNHWNVGKSLVKSASEQEQLCRLNLKAARKAKGATAYEMAYQYALTGISLLALDSWQGKYDLLITLHELAAESAYLKGDFANSKHWAESLLKHARFVLDEIKVHEINLLAYVAQKKSMEAIELGQQTLERLGILIPTSPKNADIQQAWADVSDLIPQTKIQSLLTLPRMKDAYALAALRILNSMAATVYLTQPKLFPLIVLAQVKLSLLHGNTPVSAGAYARYSFMLCSQLNAIELGYEFGCLALKLSEQLNHKEINTRVLLMVGALTLPWKVHLREGIPLLQTAYLNGLESGNLDGAALSHYYESQSSYIVGEQLQELAHKVETYSAQIRQIKQEFHLNNNELLRQVILNLIGNVENPSQLVGEAFDEEKMLPLYHSSSNMLGLYCFYLHKLMLCYWLGQGEAAIEYATSAANYLAGSTAQATIPLFYFYDSLARLSRWTTTSKSEQKSILAQVNENQQKISHWAKHAPMNFQHKYDLVLAEQHHCLGQKPETIDLYDQAIAGAKINGYIQEQALANELAAKFYLDWGKEKVAAGYMQEAYYCYSRWGAKAKIADLEKRYPDLLRPILQPAEASGSILDTLMTIAPPTMSAHASTHQSSSSTNLNQRIDFAAILKASQALSGTIQLDDLLHQLTQIILQNSGGDRCALVLPDETGEWQVRAIATPDETQLCADPLTNNPNVPIKLIQYVKNTQEVVVVDDLETNLPVIGDYLRQRQPKSLLCMSILNQGHLIGILYLKNRLTSGVFTEERILVLNFLCTQAAIALENARLYRQEQQKSKEIAQKETEYRSIFESATDGLLITDLATGQTIGVNPTMCQMHGYSQEEWFTLQPSDFIHPSCLHVFENFVETLNRGEEFYVQGMNLHKDGSALDVEVKSVPFSYQGKPCGLSIIRDIGDRKRAEEAVLQKSQALETALTELQKTQLQLVQSEKMSALGGLVSGVAHEINNPVGCIIGNVGATRDYINDLLSLLDCYNQQFPEPGSDIEAALEAVDLDYVREDLPRLIRAMKDSGERIKSISKSLRTFSRADTDTKQVFDLHEGIESTVLILRHRLKANEQRPEIEVVTDYGNIPQIDCFPGQLNQVFMNILANAIDALDEASQNQRYAELKVNPQRILIRTVMEDNWVAVSIADNGPGIPDNLKTRIFDPSFTTKSVGKGTGLGLAIARQIIVDTHGGSLEAQSEVGQGTGFCLRLPI